MRLGEMLVGEGLLAPEGVEEALESQVVHGGRLGTNLLELGLVEEKDLARALGKQHNVSFASGEMKADPRALELVEASFADDKDLVPMRVDATRLTLATINPGDFQTMDAIGFRAGKRVMPVVIPEFRMNQLLRRYYKAFRPMRAIDMNMVRPSRTLAPKEEAPEKEESDLMSEEEFQGLYAQALRGGAPPTDPKLRAVKRPQASEAPADPAQLGVASSEPAPAPLGFAEAQKLLQSSNDREDVGRTVLRFALAKWRRALLLSVQGDLLIGWHGVGQGIRERAVQQIGIPLRPSSTFKLVHDTRSHYVGPVKRDAGTAVFYKLLGGGFPGTAVMLPLLVREKLVHILYVDNGPDQLTPPDVGELLILSQSVARSYEAMLRRRMAARS